MKGMDRLLRLRQAGKLPTMVAIRVASKCWVTDHWHEVDGICPHLLVEPKDAVGRLDLRALVKVPVVDVSGHEADAKRVKAVFDACVRAGAERVLGAIHRRKGEGLEAIEYMDTAGVLTWQP